MYENVAGQLAHYRKPNHLHGHGLQPPLTTRLATKEKIRLPVNAFL